MAGAPGAGKSTYVSQLEYELDNAVVISGDCIRSEFEDPSWVEIWDRLEEEISQAAEEGKNVILDGTHVGRQGRQETVTLLQSYGYIQIEVIVMDTPLELCLDRNSKRKRTVPDYVVEHMHKTLQVTLPYIDTEHFTKVTVIS